MIRHELLANTYWCCLHMWYFIKFITVCIIVCAAHQNFEMHTWNDDEILHSKGFWMKFWGSEGLCIIHNQHFSFKQKNIFLMQITESEYLISSLCKTVGEKFICQVFNSVFFISILFCRQYRGQCIKRRGLCGVSHTTAE